MNDVILTGGCFCGDIRFEAAGPIRFCCFCHCESCRRAAGSAFVAWATFDKSSFNVISGQMTLHHSTPGVTRGHCSQCGTSLSYEHADRFGEIDITATSFDDPSPFAPAAHIWVEDKLPWVSIDDGLPQYAQTVVTD
ncbi:MAG: GFA family protein [Gammaproteobacteria bacterium]|nr:GFA family protein [Gammaproteobacteria bacterium]